MSRAGCDGLLQPKPANDTLSFGTTFTDHMLEVDWTATAGWGAPVISPYHNFQMDPAASVLHYALEVRGTLFPGAVVWRV